MNVVFGVPPALGVGSSMFNVERSSDLGRSMFNVQCSTFNVRPDSAAGFATGPAWSKGA